MAFYALLHGGMLYLKNRQEQAALRDTSHIQKNVEDRFRIFLNVQLSIGMSSADYFSTGDLKTMGYGNYADELIRINNGVRGLNLLDENGIIIRGFPEAQNKQAIGKVSQNYFQFYQAYKEGKHFWFSSPFKLYQGEMGFVYYIPIIKDQKLKGWFAPVISSKSFFEKFKLSEILHTFDLNIVDKETGLNYFSSGLLPESNQKIYQDEMDMMGRPILLQMWRKHSEVMFNLPWYFNFLMATVLAMILVFVTWLHDARKKAHIQLEDIGMLLKLTSKDALSKLMEEETSVSDRNTFLSNLLEQIDLLQTMAKSGEGPDQEEQLLAPLMREQLDNLEDVISKKSLIIAFNEKSFRDGKVFANRSLVQNCILGNSLVHSILHAKAESTIVISYEKNEDFNFITIHNSQVSGKADPFHIDRRLEVARRVVALYQGEYFLQKDLSEGMIIRIKLPLA